MPVSPIHYGQYALMDRVTSFWRLADGIDACVKNDLTAVNAPTFAATGGKPDGTVQLLSASSQYLTRTNANCKGLDFGTGSFSISMWMNPTGLPIVTSLALQKGGDIAGNAGFSLRYIAAGAGTVVLGAADGTTLYTSGVGSLVPISAWAHVVAVCNRQDNTLKVYINAAQTASGSCAGMGSVTNTSALLFSGTPLEYNGKLSDVGIWTRVLNQTDITALYNGGAGIPYPFAR